MPLPQGLRPETQPPGRARREVLDEDVGLFEQACQDLSCALLLEIQGQGLLGVVEPDEVAREPLHRGVVGAGEVPRLRSLHLYDPRAEVGELAGGEGGGDRLLQSDDRYTFERAHFQKDLGRPRTCSAT
jgi:hypothetical protein